MSQTPQPRRLLDSHPSPDTIEISPHALERFRIRHARAGMGTISSKVAVLAIRRMLPKAVEDHLDESTRVKRIISNDFQGAEYWRFAQWRFVVGRPRGVVTLLTCERTIPWQN